jgi:hypothetical protein
MLPVEYIAQNLKKYAFVDNDKARIELLIPFELWNEIVNEAIEMEKINILAHQANENHWKECLNYQISDEVIEQAKWCECAGKYLYVAQAHLAFVNGAKWYREQLKM